MANSTTTTMRLASMNLATSSRGRASVCPGMRLVTKKSINSQFKLMDCKTIRLQRTLGTQLNRRSHVVAVRSEMVSDEDAFDKIFTTITSGILGIGAFVYFCVVTVPPANVGVPVTLGSVSESTMTSGIHLKTPLTKVLPFDTRTLLMESANVVPTKDGLNVDLSVDLLYRVNPEAVRQVFLQVGEKYDTVIVEPELRSAIRNLTSENSAQALYTEGRIVLRDQLQQELTQKLAARGIQVEDVLIKSLTLPETLTTAIQQKLKVEQEAQQMEFVLTKARAEAERKAIEAEGIAQFQKIVSQGISPELLKWKGIEATEKIAESENSKVVIIGNSDQSLPVILNNDAGDTGK